MQRVNEIELSKYIINKLADKNKRVNHLKLQKLLYYIQAWHLVYMDEPLFDSDFEAWLHGPVVRKVWDYYKSKSIMLDDLPIEKEVSIDLTEEQEEIINDVLDEYGDKSGYYLECLTHSELPWKEARRKGENTIIPKQKIKEYYESLLNE